MNKPNEFGIDHLQANVANILNAEFGDASGVQCLPRARDVAVKLQDTIASLHAKTSVVDGDAESPNRLASVLRSANAALAQSRTLLSRRTDILTDVESHSASVNSRLNDLRPAVEQIHQLEKYQRYLEWLKEIQNISNKINDALHSKSTQDAVFEFVALSSLCDTMKGTSCLNLRSFIQETRNAWHTNLKNMLDKEFQEILKVMKWPFVASITEPCSTPSFDVLLRFETTFGYLLDIEPLSSYDEDGNWLLPLRLLFRPFRWRFIYHFTGNKKTNCLNKPEWYFTQVLTWIRTHVGYLDTYVQPVLNRASRADVVAKVDFINYLLSLVTDKLTVDIPKARSQESILAHIIDETLLFERELRGYGYQPGSFPSAVSVLMKDNCFPTWLKLEREAALDNMDKVFANEQLWKPLCSDNNDAQDNKVPECAEKFITMILSITDRYKYLTMPSHRLQFLYLQLELIDDFRIRLLQLVRNEAKEPLGAKFCAILNAIYYVANVLRDWSDLPMQFYRVRHRQLQCEHRSERSAKERRTDDEVDGNCLSPSVSSEDSHFFELNYLDDELQKCAQNLPEGAMFDDIVALYERIKEDMIASVADFTVLEVKAKSYHYRHEKWFSMPPLKDFVTPSLTPSACGMLQTLTSSLNDLRDSLAHSLFAAAWQEISKQLDDFFFGEVISANKFNEGGAEQFNYDMTRNLFAIFSEYTRHPENHFKKIKESCLLLTLSVGSMLLLREALTEGTSDHHKTSSKRQEQREKSNRKDHALREIGVHRLTVEQVLDVFTLRTDLNHFR